MMNRNLPMKKRDMLFIVTAVTVLAYVGHHNNLFGEADGLLKAPTAQNGEYIWDDSIIDGVLTYSVLDGNDMMFKKMVDSALNEWEEVLDGELVFEKLKTGTYTDITFDEVKTLGKTKMYGFKQDVGGKTTMKGHPDMGLITQANVMIVANPQNEVQEFTIVKHEVGHALGLFEHSDNEESIMYHNADAYQNQEVKECDAELILEINYLGPDNEYDESFGPTPLQNEGCYN